MSLTGVHNKASFQAESFVPEYSLRNSSSISDIRSSLSALHVRDATITSQLRNLITTQAELSRELGRLELLRAHLSVQIILTREISNGMLEGAAETAAHLSSKVKELDLEKKHVEETLAVVEQVVELKACIQGAVASMGVLQDWEAAAGYISRASKIPNDIVNGEFATRIIPSVEVPDMPAVVINNAKDSLCKLFLREFEKATKEGDGSKVTRFFKLFPLIKKEETGLQAYGNYICQGVAARARGNLAEPATGRDGLFYANTLSRLFEHLAQIIEGHGGIVERHYGKGMMTKVIERLQLEADLQSCIILDDWAEKRNIDKRLIDAKSYPFLFLVQSFTSGQKNLNISRTSSPAVGGSTYNNIHEDDSGIDMKEIDEILIETAMMLGRWSLYSRFLAGKCRDQESNPDDPLMMPEILVNSTLADKVSSRLTNSFSFLTTFFFRRSVEKAFQLDELPSGLNLNISKSLDSNPPYIISAVDDVMYIVSTVLQRSLSTSQRNIISSVVPTIGRVLGSDFIGMIQRKMRDESYPKPMIQGGLPPEEKVVAFIVLVNSLELANEYINRIITSYLIPANSSDPNPLKEMFPFDQDSRFVATTLENLNTTFASQVMELHSDGLHVMFNQVVKPRLRTILSDTFRDVDYLLSEDDLAELAHEKNSDFESFKELVVYRFEHNWDAIMKPIQRIMATISFSSLLDQTVKYLARGLEKRVWSLEGKINAFGAQRIEKDVSGIIRVVARGSRYGIRDLFARVSQICMLANMEDEEWNALSGFCEEENGKEEDDKMIWTLSGDERRKARRLIKE